MALALAICALILNAILFNTLLRGLFARFNLFMLERCCPQHLRAETVELIMHALIIIIVTLCFIFAFEASPCIPLIDFNIDYFSYYLPDMQPENFVLSMVYTTVAGAVYYGFKLVIYAFLLGLGLNMIDTKRIRDQTTEFKKKAKLNSTCPICKDETGVSCSTVVRCVNNHPIHRECLDSLIEHQCKKVLAVPSESSLIGCSVCRATFTKEQLTNAGGGAKAKVLSLLKQVESADAALSKLDPEQQVKTGNKDCYMCPKCNFGPVAHTACADLSAHDGKRGVSNKCPKCSFFTDKISKWKKWDGGRDGAAPEEVISSSEELVMDFCAVTLETARDMLRKNSNAQHVIANFVQGAPTAHVVSPSARQPQAISSVQHSRSLHAAPLSLKSSNACRRVAKA
jgi:hypothetical protein